VSAPPLDKEECAAEPPLLGETTAQLLLLRIGLAAAAAAAAALRRSCGEAPAPLLGDVLARRGWEFPRTGEEEETLALCCGDPARPFSEARGFSEDLSFELYLLLDAVDGVLALMPDTSPSGPAALVVEAGAGDAFDTTVHPGKQVGGGRPAEDPGELFCRSSDLARKLGAECR